jgi:hypothetical protein
MSLQSHVRQHKGAGSREDIRDGHLSVHRDNPGRQRPRCRRSHQGSQPWQLQIRQCGGAVERETEDGTKVVLEDLTKVDGVVQTNIIAVVKPVKH